MSNLIYCGRAIAEHSVIERKGVPLVRFRYADKSYSEYEYDHATLAEWNAGHRYARGGKTREGGPKTWKRSDYSMPNYYL